MSQKIGRPLTNEDHVHHVDFNKFNNDPSNLVILTAAEHNKLHKRKHEPREIKCKVCSKPTFNPVCCSLTCGAKLAQRMGRPDVERLTEDLKTMNYREIAKKYRVSTVILKHWLRGYKIR